MTNPISPPPKLVGEWLTEAADLHLLIPSNLDYLATRAAQWGADQELEACVEWLQDPDLNVDTYKLRLARRPETPMLKEEALEAWEIANQTWTTASDKKVATIILRAIKALPND
jgi:hypothetical protein